MEEGGWRRNEVIPRRRLQPCSRANCLTYFATKTKQNIKTCIRLYLRNSSFVYLSFYSKVFCFSAFRIGVTGTFAVTTCVSFGIHGTSIILPGFRIHLGSNACLTVAMTSTVS